MPHPTVCRTRDLTVFALLGALLFAGDIAFEGLPNLHPVATLTIAYTIVYRWRALIPLYIYVFLTGLSWGFQVAWVPYLIVWLPLVLLTLAVPRRAPVFLSATLYTVIAALHGFAFGLLWAPFQMALYGMPLSSLPAWIVSGLPYDLIHGLGNAAMSLAILPLSRLLARLEGKEQ